MSSVDKILETAANRKDTKQPKELTPIQRTVKEMGLTMSASARRPSSTIDNLSKILNYHHITLRYNILQRKSEIHIPNTVFEGNSCEERALTHLMSLCSFYDMPTGQVPHYVEYLANLKPYNPALDWVKSKPWDGQDRLASFGANLVVDPKNEKLKNVLLLKWLIQGIAALHNDGSWQLSAVLVLQGAQGIGKTTWLAKLVPPHSDFFKDGLELKPNDKDSVAKVCSYWIAELGELDATFRKSDQASLKAFLSMGKDVYRAPYGRKAETYVRRTVFAASVNDSEFLYDRTDNRRFWVLAVNSIGREEVDNQQVWAQALELYKTGVSHYLEESEMLLLNSSNEDFLTETTIEDRVRCKYQWEAPEAQWEEKTLDQIMNFIDIDGRHSRDRNRAAVLIQKMSGTKRRRLGSDGRPYVYKVPPEKGWNMGI